MSKKQFILIILDGWGIAPAWGGNAISRAKTKCFDRIWQKYPSTTLLASGGAVGLPTNAPGNSEAGHLNLGAGRVVRQDITLIDSQIDDGSFYKNTVLLGAITHAKKNKSKVHLMGLLSKTGNHSHINHLFSLLKLCKKNNFKNVNIHLFSDGRDSDPMSGIELVEEVEAKISELKIGKIVSISGRYFAMDRDNRWGRISRAYNAMTKSEGEVFLSAKKAFSNAYENGITDEFIEPRLIANKSQKIEKIENNDSVILFNFRGDRIKEIIAAFLSPTLSEFPDRKKINNLYLASFAMYEGGRFVKSPFYPQIVQSSLAEILSNNNLSQLHIAETEKYPHVTNFFNGGRTKPFKKERRVMIPSVRSVKTYDYAPKMSANEVCTSVISALNKRKFDFIIANFANADMVGHTGNLEAVTQAVSFVDSCLEKIIDNVLSLEGMAFVCADHGNAEQMVNPRTGDPDTEHTTNPVPFILVDRDLKKTSIKLKSDGILASVAPTILEVMNIKKPVEISNESLIIHEKKHD